MHSYRALLVGSGFGRLFLAYGLARIPVGINALAMAMVSQSVSGSTAVAGWATAFYLFALGIQAPLLGRWIDQHGPGGLMPIGVGLHVSALAGFVHSAMVPASTPAMLLCCALAGLTMPPVSAVFRAVLRKADLPEAERHAAFALDAVLVELCFIGGPLLAAVCAALGHTWVALVVSGVMAGVGCAMFVAAGGVSRWGEPQTKLARQWAGPLHLVAVRRVMLAMALTGAAVGLLELGLTAAAAAMGSPPAVGWSFAALSLTSALVGLLHGSRTWPWPQGRQFAAGALWLALGAAALATAPTVTVMVLMCLVAGCGFAPTFTSSHSAMADAAPAAQTTEAFTWLGTVLMIGIGAGWALGGLLAEASSWRMVMGGSAACMLAAAAQGMRFVPSAAQPA